MFKKVVALIYILVFSICGLIAQNTVTIHVEIKDENGFVIPFVDVANRRIQFGFSSDKEGKFTTQLLKTDSLILLKRGYVTQIISLKDSLSKKDYFLKIEMPRVPIELTEVQISAIKSHQQIRKEINKIAEPDYRLHPDAKPLMNPLSYLYQLISKKEKEKALVAKLETEEAKRIVLKELFRLYNNYNIIDLPENDYDNFISYMNLPYEFMQNVSDYDLAVSIKKLYKYYRADKSNWIKKEVYPPALDDIEFIHQQQQQKN
ncbi:MAG: hypothetical protein H6553_12490 [Chitinophagales bacterium]|nr:hypothetical protein [Chitinophagales bacterium]